MPILKSIIDKAVNSISIHEINKIKDKWILKNSDKAKYNINKNTVESSFLEFISVKKINYCLVYNLHRNILFFTKIILVKDY